MPFPPQSSDVDITQIDLTPAERRVLQTLELGLSNKGIAEVLIVSPRTVESHLSNLLAKTGCQNRTQLVLWSLAER